MEFFSSAQEWLEPAPLEFQDLDAVETFEVQEVNVEEEDVATATLVDSDAVNRGAEVIGWAARLSGLLCTLNSK